MVENVSNITNSKPTMSKIAYLKNEMQKIEDKQGIFGKAWNSVKEFTTFGTSEKECHSLLEQYQNGKISFEEVADYLNKYEQKQENMTELVKNIATGAAAIAFTTVTAGAGLGFAAAIKTGAPIVGAAVKSALGAADRATNGVDNDVLDVKQIAKDGISGAVTGLTSAVASGVGKGIKNANFAESVLNGTKCGVLCGAMSGSTSYLTNVALEEDKKFNFGDLTYTTLTSAGISGVVGATVGAGMYGNAALHNQLGENAVKSSAIADSFTSSLRKLLGREVRDVVST